MSRIGKLETITPTRRYAAVVAPTGAEADSPIADSPSQVSSTGETLEVQIVSGEAGLVDLSQAIEIDTKSMAGVGLLSGFLMWLPSWSISLFGHVTLIIFLAVVATSSVGNKPSLDLDAIFVEPNEITDATEYDRELNEVETELLNIDVAALNSEASEKTADLVREEGVQVSLFEGEGAGFGLKDLADSGLTPVETVDDEGVVGDEGKTTNFFGTEAKGNRFVFIIDASGSMTDGFLWQRAVTELGKSLGKLDEKQKVMVLLYNSHTIPMFNTPPDELKMLPVTHKFKVALGKWLYDQNPFGKTMPAHALRYGLSLQPDAIFLLSDGQLNDNSFEMLAQLNLPQKTKEGDATKVPVHTISLGPNELGVLLMRMIADSNDGNFVRVK